MRQIPNVDELLETTRAIVADGEAIVEKAQQDFSRAARPITTSGRVTGSLLGETTASLIQNIISYERNPRQWVPAAMALARLRETYDAFDPRNLAPDEQNWEAFAGKHVPLSPERIAELIGKMVFKGGRLQCLGCGTHTVCRCSCGVPYINEHEWGRRIAPGTVTENVTERRHHGPVPSGKAMTDAERARKYRKRKRNLAQPASNREAKDSYKFAYMNRIDTAWRLIDAYDGVAPEILDDEMCALMEATAAKATALAKQLREMRHE